VQVTIFDVTRWGLGLNMLFSRINDFNSGRVQSQQRVEHQSGNEKRVARRRIYLATTALAAVSLTMTFAPSAHAQSVWGGGGATTITPDYNLGTNWSTSPTAPVAANSSAQFGDGTGGSGGTASTSVSVTAPVVPDAWTFLANSQSYAVTGSTVAVGQISNLANAGQAISIANNMTGGVLIQGGASTLTISGTISIGATNVTGGTLVNTGSLTSAVVINGGATFTTTNQTSGGITNTGTVNAQGATGGALQNNNAGIWNVTGALTGDNTFTNNGTAQLAVSGGDFTGITTFNNNSTSAFAVSVSAGRTLGATTILNNAGTFTNAGTVASLSNTGGTFDNSGTVTGASTVSGGVVTNTGAFQSTLGVSAGTFNMTAGSVAGTTSNTGGLVTNNGGAFGAVVNTSGTFNNNTGTAGAVSNAATGTNDGTIASLNNTGGTFGNNGTVTGASTVSGGVVTNTGDFQSTLGVSAGTFNMTAGSVAGTTTNTGGLVTNNGGTFGIVNNNVGTFNNVTGNADVVSNAATGTNGDTIDSLNNTGGTFANSGTVTAASTVSGGTVTNTGTFQTTLGVSGGTFNMTAGSVAGTTTNTGGLVTNNGGTFGVVNNNAGTFNNNSGTADAVSNAATGTNGGTIGSLNNTAGTFGNSGIVIGTSTVSGGAVTNTGTFQSTLGVSGGTFTNNGPGQVQGPMTITGGTVTINGGSFAEVNNSSTFIVGGTSASGVFTNNAPGTLSVNAGTFTVTGTLTNSSQVTVAGGVTLTATNVTNTATGTILNNGTINGGTTVAGGTLSGTGNTQNLTVNAGTFAPGNGTAGSSMTVTGSFVFQAAAAYLIQIDPTTASFTNVTGTATLNGGTVNANFANGSYVSKRYTIVTAASVNGTFGSVANTNLPANMHTSLSYDATHAYLDLALNFSMPGGVLTQNQQAVGNALADFFNRTGGIPLTFAMLTAPQLTQAAGETATGTQQTTFDAMTQFMGLMTDPFIAGRGDGMSSAGGAPAYADEAQSATAYAANGKPRSRDERDAYAAIYRKAPAMADPFAQRWSVWAAAYGGSQTTDGNAAVGSNNVTSRVYGIAAGADYRLSPYTLAGFALAGGGTNFSIANGLGSGRSDLFQAGAWLRHNAGAAYLTAALAYGWQDITTDRTVTIAGIDQLRAKFNANAWSGRIEGGYRVVSQGVGFTPYAAGQFVTFQLPSYAEGVISGANTFALAYGAKDVTASRSELGLRTDKSFAVQDGIFTLRGRAAWAHNFNTDRSVLPTFQALPGASFVVNGAGQAPDAALATASAEMKWLNGFSVAGTFEGEFSNVTRSYAGKGVARYSW
jgi:uncharacterized protein with beta-barrel porin domain